MSAWSLLSCPAVLTVDLQPEQNAPLPIPRRIEKSRSFGNVLEPRYIFGADSLDQ
jgi:hypothetical protein